MWSRMLCRENCMCAMCYADYLTMISPSRRSMEIMLQICEDFATEYQVKFNSTKRVLITYDIQNEVSFTLVVIM